MPRTRWPSSTREAGVVQGCPDRPAGAGGADGVVAAVVPCVRRADPRRRTGRHHRPRAGAGDRAGPVAAAAQLAHPAAAGRAAAGHPAVFRHVLEQLHPGVPPAGRAAVLRRARGVGAVPPAVPGPPGADGPVHPAHAAALPGHDGAQLPGAGWPGPDGHPLGADPAGVLLGLRGVRHGPRVRRRAAPPAGSRRHRRRRPGAHLLAHRAAAGRAGDPVGAGAGFSGRLERHRTAHDLLERPCPLAAGPLPGLRRRG